MTLLSPSSLLFLGAIGIPIIIHILSRLSIKKVDFSTIRFIKSLENNAIRNVEIKKWILLLLRIGFITALVLMISRPVTKGFMPGWISAELESRLILVIDNSSSMSGKKKSITLLESVKKAALSVPQIFNKSTTVNVFQTCPPRLLYSGDINDQAMLSVINQIRPTVSYDNLWKAVDSLIGTINAIEPIKECIIFSDFQNNVFPSSPILKTWKFYLVNPGEIINNLSINNLEVVSRIKVPDQLLKLKTNIKNSGNKKVTNTPINLLFGENRVGQVISEFDKGSNKEFIFQAYPEKKGVLVGSVHLPNDDYINDNTWYITAPILEKISCLMVGSTNEEKAMFELIIDAIDPEKQLINFETRNQPIINRLFLDDFDILVIHNPEAVTEAAFDEIDVFLQEGGGLIWFSGGMEMDPTYNKYFSSFGFPKAKSLIGSGSGIFSVNIPDKDDHLLSDISIRKLENELPECYQYIRHSYSNKHSIHLQLNNGDPLLLEFNRGSGNIFYFTSLLDLAWNDIPIRGILVPLMYRLLILGGTDELSTLPVTVGSTKWISLDQNEVRDQWEVKSPSGEKALIVPDFSKEGIEIKKLDELGVYEIYQNGKHFTSFSTFIHPNESISKKPDSDQISNFLSEESYRWIKLDNNFIDNFNEIRQGKSLWKIFLLIATIFLLVETWIGRPVIKNVKQ
jgi:hypothetical protein|tara:strand:+ start:7427 stop:9472 length:2046 start_codon:yes stop_codon:yes gene_type:complete